VLLKFTFLWWGENSRGGARGRRTNHWPEPGGSRIAWLDWDFLLFYFFTFFFVQEAFLSNFFTRFLDGRAVWWSTVGLFCYRPSLFTLLGAGRIGGHECSRS